MMDFAAGGKAFVYKDAALRTCMNQFETMVTHPCVIRPTDQAVVSKHDEC